MTVASPASAIDELDDDLRLQVLAKAFAALSEPVRLRILELLDASGEATVGELTAALPVTQARVSVHLRCLTECGFTTVRRSGRNAHYRLASPHTVELVAVMRDHSATALEGILDCLGCESPAPGDHLGVVECASSGGCA